MNLCEILKGHAGETFYSILSGEVKLSGIKERQLEFIRENGSTFYVQSDGIYSFGDDLNLHGECIIFPSKDKRDWGVWMLEQKTKHPKVWDDVLEPKSYLYTKLLIIEQDLRTISGPILEESYPFFKSILAAYKINKLIDLGYGGNITTQEWESPSVMKFEIYYDHCRKIFITKNSTTVKSGSPVFHTIDQATEFLGYQSNKQLLKDYYGI